MAIGHDVRYVRTWRGLEVARVLTVDSYAHHTWRALKTRQLLTDATSTYVSVECWYYEGLQIWIFSLTYQFFIAITLFLVELLTIPYTGNN